MTSTIKVNTIQNACGADIIKESSNTITIGASGDTVTLASGASQTGFGRTGTVDWNTTKKTANFDATNGDGFFVDTSSTAITATLPASPSAGNIVAFSDYTGTFSSNALTIARNGSNINGAASDLSIDKPNTSVQLIYVDATEGWRTVLTGSLSDLQATYITATGGTITTSGNFKIHTFTGPGTFCVSCAGDVATVDYLVVAGGAGGGGGKDPESVHGGGGGGAGGLRYSADTYCNPAPGPSAGSVIPVSAQGYPITVGGGGPGAAVNTPNASSDGNNSVFSTIISAGGGAGGARLTTASGRCGGSGGGATTAGGAGAGNTPPVSPPQGNDGGNDSDNPVAAMGGGGGAGAVGAAGTTSAVGAGGAGLRVDINGSPTTYAGGGGGGSSASPQPINTAAAGGSGGGGAGGNSPGDPGSNGTAGSTNTGGGGGGAGSKAGGGNGGSGVVIIRYKFQSS